MDSATFSSSLLFVFISSTSSRPPLDITSIFTIQNGVLKGPTIAGDSGLVRSYPAAGRSGFLRGGMPLEIHVEFDPKELGQVEERFRIEVKGGERVDLVLRGEGVLDENLL